MLGRSLQEVPDLQMLTFSWKTALFGSYDVFQVHWPEILVSGRTRVRSTIRQALFLLLLLRLRITRRPLVRTMHNLSLPDGLSRSQTALLTLGQRWTNLRVLINSTTVLPPDQASVVILHGHYRDWFAEFPVSDTVPGRITFFGLVRRYKGVDTLIRAFRATRTAMPEASLRVAGKPSTAELADSLVADAGDDLRITTHFEFLSEAALVIEATEAELVALPYREMHNSGGALTALSLDRPILVPDNHGNQQLSEEVGPGWVYTYQGELTATDLETTIAAVRSTDRSEPDLSAREWDRAGQDHLAAYRVALGLSRRYS